MASEQDLIYCDHNASTPLSPVVASAIAEAMTAGLGNPSSQHWAGRASRALVDQARTQVADAFDVAPAQVIFTSGGTEGDNHALLAALQLQAPRCGLTISAIEHPAVADLAQLLAERGQVDLRQLAVRQNGIVDKTMAATVIDHETALMACMLANNETGAIQPVQELCASAREQGALSHVDAAQAVGKIPVDFSGLGCDMMAIAGHKFGAPKGIGALLVREGLDLPPMLIGGGHEQGRRPGTESTLLIAALGAACAALPQRLQDMQTVAAWRDEFELALQQSFGAEIVIQAAEAERLPNTSSVAFCGRLGHEVLTALPEVAASTGSACHAGQVQLSPVLAAMQIPETQGLGTVRFSFGPENSREDLQALIALLRARLTAVPKREIEERT